MLAAIALAVTVASLVGAGDVKLAVIPLGLVAGSGLVYLALTRFELFVLVCLFLRTSLDVIGGKGTTITNPSSLLSLTFMAASLLWLAARSYRGERFTSTLSLPLLFFAAACFLSALTSKLHAVSFTEFSRILSVVIMALVLERLATTPAAVRRIMIAAMGSAVIPLRGVVPGLCRGGPADGQAGRAGGRHQAGPRHVRPGQRLLPLPALHHHHGRRARTRTSPSGGGCRWSVGLAGLGILMILTYTRSSWMALVIGLLVVGWLQSKRLLLALVVLGLGVALFVPSVVNRFADLTADNGPSTALTGEGNSLAWRFSYWTEVITLAADNPVTGIGLRVTEEISGGAKQPHNDFVRAYVELGAIGLMAYILLLTAMARVAARGVRDAAAGWQRGVAVGFAGCFVAFVLVSLVANVMSQAVVLWYLFAFAACAAAVGKFGWIDKQNAKEAGGRPVPISA